MDKRKSNLSAIRGLFPQYVRGQAWPQIKQKGWGYWIRVVLVGAVGLFLGHVLTGVNSFGLQNFRYALYQFITDRTPRPPLSGDILLVAITDDEYWKGELAGRIPIKREYLGKLVNTICSAGPKVVGLDFDMRSPVTDGSLVDHVDYKLETDALASSINAAARRDCKIVLPRTLNCASTPCTKESSVLDVYEFDFEKVTEGFINVPNDIRQVPLGGRGLSPDGLPSFAQAIARADTGIMYDPSTTGENLPYISFIWPKRFIEGGKRLSASQILTFSTPQLRAAVAHKTVMVGADWSRTAYRRGKLVDLHPAPVGEIAGLYLHANYAAALIDNRLYRTAGKRVATGVEILLVAFVAVLFAIKLSSLKRLLLILAAAFGLIVVAYLSWQNFSIFVEPIVPILLLVFHWLYDENRHMRRQLQLLQRGGAATGQ